MMFWLVHIAAWRSVHDAMMRATIEFLDYEEDKARRGL